MRRKTVLILQDTKEQNEELKQKLESLGDYEVVGTFEDGISAISMVRDKNPDFLITGLVLSGYDGLSVIGRIRESNKHIKIIVVSALKREEIISRALGAGASYFMAKPYNIEALIERMDELANDALGASRQDSDSNFRKTTLDEKISKIFINVGIPPHIKGYAFLREGVKMAVEEPSIINSITKKLYPSIGEKYSTSASKVERAIRHAIEVAWNRGRIETINNILGVRAYVGAEKPTNGEFIALVADKMILEKV